MPSVDAALAPNESYTALVVSPDAALVWTSMPAVLTEFKGLAIFRNRFDLHNFSSARLIVNVATASTSATAQLRVQCSVDNGVNWRSINAALNAPFAVLNVVGLVTGAWCEIDIINRFDVLLRIVGINGAGSPAFGSIYLQVK